MNTPRIGFGAVWHRRLRPVEHAFCYRSYFLLLPLRSLREQPCQSLNRNRRGWMSFQDRDHGQGGDDALAWFEQVLEAEGIDDAEEFYRLVTTILDPAQAPATELAALYCERWEIEGALDELKTHLRGARIVLRSKTPALVRQEFYGLLMAHFAIRGLMHEAAVRADQDPDRLSYLHAVRVVRRKLARAVAIPPSGQGSV